MFDALLKKNKDSKEFVKWLNEEQQILEDWGLWAQGVDELTRYKILKGYFNKG